MPELESVVRGQTGKIFLQQYRPSAAMPAPNLVLMDSIKATCEGKGNEIVFADAL